MSVLPLDVATIDPAHIQRLIDERVAEQRCLDYKEQLPGGRDGDKKEFSDARQD